MQFGVGIQDGVAQMLERARRLAKKSPHRLLLALDVNNVFGNIDRAVVRTALGKRAPDLLPAVSQSW
eukprot:1865016-Lingulodinium_polyedra.AAC.1